jgi:hypothetical protein
MMICMFFLWFMGGDAIGLAHRFGDEPGDGHPAGMVKHPSSYCAGFPP